MARPLRIEFPNALYHVMARGDRRRPIFLKDDDYRQLLLRLAWTCERFNFVVHAYCLMPNHYHLMVETLDGALSKGMKHLNSTYAQLFNRRYDSVGHVFQGRYKAILVQKESYLLELSRYIVLNPVRAKLTEHPELWRWSSLQYTLGKQGCPTWLERDWLLKQFGEQADTARSAFHDYVRDGHSQLNPLNQAKYQLVLGDDDFLNRTKIRAVDISSTSVTRNQRRSSVLSLADYESSYPCKDEAIARAYRSLAFSMVEIGAHFNMLPGSVSRAIRRFEGRQT